MAVDPAFNVIHVFTTNKGKMDEYAARFNPLGIQVVQFSEGYPELQADSHDEVMMFASPFVADALLKINGISCIYDDSGLWIDALEGFPGVFSAHAQKTIGNEGVLKLLGREKAEARTAAFKCSLGFITLVERAKSWPGRKEVYGHEGASLFLFTSSVAGRIVTAQKGQGGFGYDPIFIPDGHKETYASMTSEEKNRVSHRALVIDQLIKFLETNAGKSPT